MRKWRIIGVMCALVAIGALAFVFSQPKPGTVEWHKREYRAAFNRIAHNTAFDRVKRGYYNASNSGPPARPWGWQQLEDAKQMSSNWTALLRFGYLARCTVLLSNRPARELEIDFVREQKPNPFVQVRTHEEGLLSDVVFVTAPQSEITNISNIIRRIDERGR